MKQLKKVWLKLLVDTMERWREAQKAALEGGRDALNKYLNGTDCPLCKSASNICAHCMVTEITGKRCHNIESYQKLEAARSPATINEAIQLMFVDMNFIYEKLEGDDNNEVVNDEEATRSK